MTNIQHRQSLPGIISGLMLAETMAEVADEINHLCDLAGIPRPEGGFIDGWTDQDFVNVGIHQAEDEEDSAA